MNSNFVALMVMFPGIVLVSSQYLNWVTPGSKIGYEHHPIQGKCSGDVAIDEALSLLFYALEPRPAHPVAEYSYSGRTNSTNVIQANANFTQQVDTSWDVDQRPGIFFKFCTDQSVFASGYVKCELHKNNGYSLRKAEHSLRIKKAPLTPVAHFSYHITRVDPHGSPQFYMLRDEYFLFACSAVVGSPHGRVIVTLYDGRTGRERRVESWSVSADSRFTPQLNSMRLGKLSFNRESTPMGPKITLTLWRKYTRDINGHWFRIQSTDISDDIERYADTGLVRTLETPPIQELSIDYKPQLSLLTVPRSFWSWEMEAVCKAPRHNRAWFAMALVTPQFTVAYYGLTGPTNNHRRAVRYHTQTTICGDALPPFFEELPDENWVIGRITVEKLWDPRSIKCQVRDLTRCREVQHRPEVVRVTERKDDHEKEAFQFNQTVQIIAVSVLGMASLLLLVVALDKVIHVFYVPLPTIPH